MTLHLTAAEEVGEGLADAVGEALTTAPAPERPAFATVVGADDRIMRVFIEPDRGLTIHVGRGAPLRLDRFQAAALALAFEHHIEGFGP